MKSRNLKWMLIVIAAVAALNPPRAAAESGWETFANQVKDKVSYWFAYWSGSATTTASNPNPQQPAAAQSKTASQQSHPSAAATKGSNDTSTVNVGSGAKTATSPSPAATAPVASVPAAKPLSSEAEVLRKQKLFELGARGMSLKDIQGMRESVRQKSLLKVAQPGRAGTSKLNKGKAGVPLSDWKKIKVSRRVPRLDIGQEDLISREDFTMDKIAFEVGRPADFKALPRPADMSREVNKALGAQVEKAYGVRSLQASMRPFGVPVSHESIEKIKYNLANSVEVKELSYKPLSEDQLKMLAAMILYGKGDSCHFVMGLFYQLAQKEPTRLEATYHLGACAHSLKMHQVAFDRLSQVVGAEDKDYGAKALELLVTEMPMIYEVDFYRLIKGIKSFKNLVTPATQDAVAYRMAKGAYRAGDHKTSIEYAKRVGSGTDYYDEARFLSAMNSFALNDRPGALQKLQELSASLESRKVQDKNIRALTAVNLARMYFAQKKYDKAYEQYMQVPKDHPLWVQALTEQGWTQIALEDYSGAIGNMYSLHSPYFKAVYQPESFVVSTIGYLNICQYGDAYKTLTWLEKDYRDFYDRTKGYLAIKSEPLDVYNSVKTYIKGKSSDNVDGVPYQVWREMAHRKDFLNVQTALNDKVDEARRYEGINERIKAEKVGIRAHATQAKKRFDEWKAKLTKIGKDPSLVKHRKNWEEGLRHEKDQTIAYRYKLTILEQSREGFLDFQGKAQKKLDSETASLTDKAGQCLRRHATVLREEMARVLDNNEFLRYEVFSGSGENIRYQVAGGKVGAPNRIPAAVKPTKMMNWSFDGEFWEDEIGSYRSALQNACPSAMTSQAKHVDEDEDEN